MLIVGEQRRLGCTRAENGMVTTDRDRAAATVAPVDIAGQSTVARLARLRAEEAVNGTGKPLPPVVNPIAARGRPFSETIIEEREDRI
jgi:hypothetical protein